MKILSLALIFVALTGCDALDHPVDNNNLRYQTFYTPDGTRCIVVREYMTSRLGVACDFNTQHHLDSIDPNLIIQPQ